VQAAPRNDLSRLSGMLWKAYAAGAIGEGAAQELAETIEARKALPPSAKSATGRCCRSRPRSSESLERRRRWCASGKLPPQLAARFTPAETAALSAIAAEVTKRGDCRLTIDHIAALAGICARSVRNAIRAAEALGGCSRSRKGCSRPSATIRTSFVLPRQNGGHGCALARGQGGGCKPCSARIQIHIFLQQRGLHQRSRGHPIGLGRTKSPILIGFGLPAGTGDHAKRKVTSATSARGHEGFPGQG
jgi:hypothetical protein